MGGSEKVLKCADVYKDGPFVKQLFRIQIQKCGKVSLWSQVKSRIEAYYSELTLVHKPPP